MALFQTFRMTEEELKRVPIQDGYFYLTTDAEGKGYVYIDWNHVRYAINSKYAQGLISSDGQTIINVEDIYNLIQNSSNSGTKEYQVTIQPDDWVNKTYTWSNSNLACGSNGVTPPRISCMQNDKEYLYIISAEATMKVGITFKVYKQPTQTIKVLIVDTVGGNSGGTILPPGSDIVNNGRIERTMDGLTITRVDIPEGYTEGGYVELDSSIENALKEIT